MTVSIKPLEWTQKAPPAHDQEPFVYWAAGLGGYYRAERDGMLWMAHDAFVWQQHRTQALAKAAAQADHETRIRAALAHDEQAEPVAYQHRIRAATPGLEWGPWEDGRAPQFRTKAYEAQERPLYATPVPEQASVPDSGLVAFAKEMIRISFDGGDAEGSDIHETALRHGLLAQIEFDPEIHSDPNGDAEAGDPEAGDPWFVFAGPLAASPRSTS